MSETYKVLQAIIPAVHQIADWHGSYKTTTDMLRDFIRHTNPILADRGLHERLELDNTLGFPRILITEEEDA